MRMAMMDVWVVWMRVCQRLMPMGMRMRLPAIPGKIMSMLMMSVMHVAMVVNQRFVRVQMVVRFA